MHESMKTLIFSLSMTQLNLMNNIKIQYDVVCKTYFPRWEPWKFIYKSTWGISGCCNPKTKCIFSGSLDKMVLIHEICHAVTNCGHGKKWQKRMLLSAKIAKKNDAKLSEEIFKDLEIYVKAIERLKKRGNSFETKNVYNQIEDAIAILKPNKKLDIDNIITNVLFENGVRKECDRYRYNRMLKRGRKIAIKTMQERAL